MFVESFSLKFVSWKRDDEDNFHSSTNFIRKFNLFILLSSK